MGKYNREYYLMASFNFPTIEELNNRIQTDVKSELPQSNPFLEVSAIQPFLTSLAGRYFENYASLNQVFLSLFLTTSTDDFLDLWGEVFGLTRLTAAKSSGLMTVTGVVGTEILSGEQLQAQSSELYEVTATQPIVLTTATLASITSVGTAATATLATPQPFATGMIINIAGANEPPYNGSFVIVMVSSTIFTYTMLSSPGVPATGTLTANANLASVPITSIDVGADTIAFSGTPLTFVATVVGVDNNTGFVGLEGIVGGTDTESDISFRNRILFRTENPVANFSESAIAEQMFSIPGVTRVSILSVTPAVGQVTMYFVRDNDTPIIPTADELTTVKNQVLTIKPAEITSLTDVIVLPPPPINTDFTFSSISPNTVTMQQAITANLIEFFRSLPLGEDIQRSAYESAIFNTTDPVTGERLQSFVLTTPTATIVIDVGEVGLVGVVTYA